MMEEKTSESRQAMVREVRELTGPRLTKLLATLDADPERAGELYEKIRRKLITMFDWRGAPDPEQLADETIDRVARKLESGVEIASADPYRYFSGVAAFVFRETLKSKKNVSFNAEVAAELPSPAEPDAAEHDIRMSCLDRCLGRLSAENRALILAYHEGDKRDRIDNRASLASRLGLSQTALRIRVHRIRENLEGCMASCLDR
jgi:DNA-directed RNA polymerase specialized sigma24 family protein